MIVAKWPVACTGCPRKIEPGELMERSGQGWVHVYCDPASEAALDAWQRDAARLVLAGTPGGWDR